MSMMTNGATSDSVLGDLAPQLAAAAASALVVASPDHGMLVVTGADRLTWLNGLVTCELANRKPGDAVYGLAVTQKGRILADVVVVVGDEEVTLVVPATQLEELRASCEKYLIMENAEIVAGAGRVSFVHGPGATSVLAAARAAGGTGGTLDRTGLGGVVVVARADVADAVDVAMEAAVRNAGGLRGDGQAWGALRVARAVPEFGADFTAATYPQEVGLEKSAVSFSKGCYLGQEVICMLEMRGHVKRRLVQMRIEGDAPARGAVVADAAGTTVGEVTSVSMAPGGGGVLALAMVKRPVAEVGGELRVGTTTAKVLAVV